MKKSTLVFVVVISWMVRITGGTKCNLTDNCKCFHDQPDEFILLCPPNRMSKSPGIRLLAQQRNIRIRCYNQDEFPFKFLPNMTFPKVEQISTYSCPQPKSFKNIFDHFHAMPNHLLVKSDFNVMFGKSLLHGVEFLEKLSIRNVKFTGVETQAFGELPNLRWLSIFNTSNLSLATYPFSNHSNKLMVLGMQHSGIEFIPDRVFASLTNLRNLSLTANGIKIISNLTFFGLRKLEELELNNNKIESVTTEGLTHLKKLKMIDLTFNKLTDISDIFHENVNLKIIGLSYNPNVILTEEIFSKLISLDYLEIHSCNLRNINLILNGSNIRIIDLHNNSISAFPQFSLEKLVKLEKLYLENNLIREIPTFLQTSLKLLYLQTNRIERINHEVFKNLANLEELDLSRNGLQYFAPDFLQATINLKILDLSHNFIKNLESINLRNTKYLETLSLENNSITELKIASLINTVANTSVSVNLDLNSIYKISVDGTEDVKNARKTIITMENCTLACDCEMYEFYQYLKDEQHGQLFEFMGLVCATPKDLKGIHLKDVSAEQFFCEELKHCPAECSCKHRSADSTLVINCTSRNLSDYPEVEEVFENAYWNFTQIELLYQNNHFRKGPKKVLKYFEKITKLFLSYNDISSIDWLPPNVKELHLDNNHLSFLSMSLLNSLTSRNLTALSLHNNKWTCDCSIIDLTHFIRKNRKIITSSEKIYCDNSTTDLFYLETDILCKSYGVYYITALLLSLSLVTTCLFLFSIYKEPLKIWLYAHEMCLWWVTEEELDKDKIYDVFISYSHKDEDFVAENLLPVLEQNPKSYKICVHQRNFIPGEFIALQITKAVLESRRTLVVLSQNFLESVWGKMEFRTAHTQAMIEGRARVIIVLYGDVDREKLDDELKAYLKTNTYLEWGDPYFWNKLRYALPHSRRNLGKSMSEEVIGKNDEFNLMELQNRNLESTPEF